MPEWTPPAPAPEPVVTFGTTSYRREKVGCRVCGRTLLLGERSVGYFTVDGSGPFDVCELCIPRAGKFGLRSVPSTPEEVSRSHRRRFPSLPSLRIPKLRRRSSTPRSTPKQRVKRSKRGATSGTALLASLGSASCVGSASIPTAVAAFNVSSDARTLAGLYKTLGQPRASVTPRSATDREVILTVAWEIVWYQFRIMLDGIESRRGSHLDELSARWQHWNCTIAPDGTVTEGDFLPENGHTGSVAEAVHAPDDEDLNR